MTTKTIEVNWLATLVKWKTAIATFRLNMSEISRESGVARQHITSIVNEASIPSIVVAERIDRAIDAAVDRRREAAKAFLEAAE
jgi:DNA-binding phage protein